MGKGHETLVAVTLSSRALGVGIGMQAPGPV